MKWQLSGLNDRQHHLGRGVIFLERENFPICARLSGEYSASLSDWVLKLKPINFTKGTDWRILLNASHALLSKQRSQTKATYDSLVRVIPAAIRGGQGGGALLSVPGGQALLWGAADGDGVDAVRVAVTVTVIALTPPVPRSPHEDGALSLSPLKEKPDYITSVIFWDRCHTPVKFPTNSCMRFSEIS